MSKFFQGVIEGFYGHQWDWAQRQRCAQQISREGYQAYVYAPKGDALLRSNWSQLFPESHFLRLQHMAKHCRELGLQWGLGLSPMELFRHYGPAQRDLLRAKLEQINALAPDVLCILFDDMPGDFPALARQQLAIIEDIATHSVADRHIVCPTYYSFDPVLEQVFGPQPSGYLPQLAAALPVNIDLFWTGSQVISPVINADDLVRATDLLGRAPVIWDNLLANDGRVSSNFLPLSAVASRDRSVLSASAGQLINPMCQPQLSGLALAALSRTSGDALLRWRQLLSPEFFALLQRDISCFSQEGLECLSDKGRSSLALEYRALADGAADEIADWLSGGYRFDPECLTE